MKEHYMTGLKNLGITAFLALSSLTGVAHAQKNYVGVAVGVVPIYEGSSEYRLIPTPIINYHSGSFFITPRAGLPAMGFKSKITSEVEAGVFVGLGLGRDASRAERTKGLNDIKFHGNYGAYLEWTPGNSSLGIAYRQATRSGYGATLDLRASHAIWQSGGHRIRLGAGTQWVNRDAMQTWYGITPQQSAQSEAGLSPYSPSSGFKSASIFTVWTFQMTPQWSTTGTLGVSTLLGNAKNSPLTEKSTNAFGSIGIVYSF